MLSVPGNADYAAFKSAVQYGTTIPLASAAVSIFDQARINAIAPGAVNAPQFRKECEAAPATLGSEAEAMAASSKSVEIEHDAKSCLMLASNNSSESSGQIFRVSIMGRTVSCIGPRGNL